MNVSTGPETQVPSQTQHVPPPRPRCASPSPPRGPLHPLLRGNPTARIAPKAGSALCVLMGFTPAPRPSLCREHASRRGDSGSPVTHFPLWSQELSGGATSRGGKGAPVAPDVTRDRRGLWGGPRIGDTRCPCHKLRGDRRTRPFPLRPGQSRGRPEHRWGNTTCPEGRARPTTHVLGSGQGGL